MCMVHGQAQTYHIAHLAPSCSKLLKHSYNELWIKKKETVQGLPSGTVDRNLPANARDMGSIPGPGRSTCRRASKSVHLNSWARGAPAQEKPPQWEGPAANRRALCSYTCRKPSVQFSRLAVSDSLWPRGLQHARPPCPSPTPRVYWNLCPLSWWCHPTISSSAETKLLIPVFSGGVGVRRRTVILKVPSPF